MQYSLASDKMLNNYLKMESIAREDAVKRKYFLLRLLIGAMNLLNDCGYLLNRMKELQ